MAAAAMFMRGPLVDEQVLEIAGNLLKISS